MEVILSLGLVFLVMFIPLALGTKFLEWTDNKKLKKAKKDDFKKFTNWKS